MHDCLIIGGGVIGLSLAYELAGQGLTVRILERGRPGREASWAGAGILPPALLCEDGHPLEPLSRLSHALHARWAADLRETTGIDNGFRRSGGLYIARDEASAARLADEVTAWRQRDIRVEPLTTNELAEFEPALCGGRESSTEAIRAAYFLPDECQVRNPRHLKSLVAACAMRGVEITSGQAVEDFEIRNGRFHAVVTATDTIPAGMVCLTAGCWSGSIARRLGCTLSVRPVRGQIVLLDTGQPPTSRIISEGLRYLVPRPDGRVLVGSTQEDAGFQCHTTTDGVAGLLTLALELVPQLAHARVERSWAGLRPATADGLPYLGRAADIENALIAAGHFRSGLLLAPATALVMSQLIRGETPQVDLTPFRIDRS